MKIKKLLSYAAELKTWICLCFTASLIIYMVIDMACGGEAMRYSLIWQLLGLCIVITVLQFTFFSDKVLKKPSYAVRMALFGVVTLLVCCGFAWGFRWFPLEEAGAWATFFLIFLAAFVAISLGFEIYFRVMGRRYDTLLARRRDDGESADKK